MKIEFNEDDFKRIREAVEELRRWEKQMEERGENWLLDFFDPTEAADWWKNDK